MGCSASRLEDEEAVQLCRDRRDFIKQAVEQRCRFALSHIAYLDSLKRVSLALLEFVEGDEHRHHHDFFADHYATSPFTPVKRSIPDVVGTSTTTTRVVNCLRPGGSNPSIPIEEWLGSPETVRVESFYPSNGYGFDGYFTYEASQMSRPSFTSSPYGRPSYLPSSPQNSQWDLFWNPFSSLDQYGQFGTGDGDIDETARLRKIRKEEGIPELEELEQEEEEDDEDEDDDDEEDGRQTPETKNENSKPVSGTATCPVAEEKKPLEPERERGKLYEAKGCQSQGVESMEVSEARDTAGVEAGEETPAFTVYVNRRPESMVEVIKDVDSQFARILDSAREVSAMLEASRAQYSAQYEITGSRRFNPAALFRTPSSLSSSSRFSQLPVVNSREEGDDASSNYSEESCTISGSHQATLDRLFAWEKRLYEEVKCGERIRKAYEKKCARLRSHDVNGEEPSIVDKTRAAIRDLRTQLNVSIHSVEAMSQRIEILRDEELCPQLMELIQGLSRMWRTMTDCHRMQKRTIDEAKLLLFCSANTATINVLGSSEVSPSRLADYAVNLVYELRSWRSCLATWVGAQRSYARALAGWTSRCVRPQIGVDGDQAAQSPNREGACTPPVFRLCVRWARLLDSVREASVVEGINMFATGVGSVSMQQREGTVGPAGTIVAVPEETSEIREKVVCAGMLAAVGALAEFAASLAEGYEALLQRCEEGGRAGRVNQ